MVDYPSNFVFDTNSKVLKWNGVTGAEFYEILTRQISPSQTDWQEAYYGTQTFCSFVSPSGSRGVKGRKGGPDGVWGEFGPEEIIVIS